MSMPSVIDDIPAQLARFKVIQSRLWEMDRTSSAVVIRLGDIPMLTLGGSVEVAAVSGYDIWVAGELAESGVTVDEAVTALLGG
jgi:hypothetical protein